MTPLRPVMNEPSIIDFVSANSDSTKPKRMSSGSSRRSWIRLDIDCSWRRRPRANHRSINGECSRGRETLAVGAAIALSRTEFIPGSCPNRPQWIGGKIRRPLKQAATFTFI
jgi:hypothetical protein